MDQLLKTPLFNLDYNDALTFAESDLKLNWESYKKRFWGCQMNKEKEMIERNLSSALSLAGISSTILNLRSSFPLILR